MLQVNSAYDTGLGENDAPTAPDNPFDDPSADIGLEFEPEVAFETATTYEPTETRISFEQSAPARTSYEQSVSGQIAFEQPAPSRISFEQPAPPRISFEQPASARISFEQPAVPAREPSMAYELPKPVRGYETAQPRPAYEEATVMTSFEALPPPLYEAAPPQSTANGPATQSSEVKEYKTSPFLGSQTMSELPQPPTALPPLHPAPAVISTSPLMSQTSHTSGEQPLSARIEHEIGSPESSQRYFLSGCTTNVNSDWQILREHLFKLSEGKLF